MARTLPNEVGLDDVILFFMCRLAEKADGERIAVPTKNIHKSLSGLESMLDELHALVRFHRDPVQVWSKQVEEAVFHLVPFELESSWKYGEGTRLELTKRAVPPRMENLRRDLSPEAIALLEANLEKFKANLE